MQSASKLGLAIEKAEAAYMQDLTAKNVISFSTDDFSATVTMNPRDAMVFAAIENLPADKDARIANLKEFKACLHNDIGGKTFLQIDPKYYQDALDAGFKPTAAHAKGVFSGAKFMDAKTTDAAMSAIINQEDAGKKAEILQWLARFEEGKKYQFIRLSKENVSEIKDDFFEKLFQFKKIHSGFVEGTDKEKQGLYSGKAEKLKAANEFVDEFVALKDGEIIGTMMIAKHSGMTYFADYIVHKDQRGHHLAQAIAYQVNQEMTKLYSAFKGIWYIAGGDGDKPLGKHLYGKIFPSKTIDADVQREQGFIVYLADPGKILCKAANRGLTAPYFSLDGVQAGLSLMAAASVKPVPVVETAVVSRLTCA